MSTISCGAVKLHPADKNSVSVDKLHEYIKEYFSHYLDDDKDIADIVIELIEDLEDAE